MKKIFSIFIAIFTLLLVTQCKKSCKPSTQDCSLIYYQCEPGQEVCGCDGKTYNCAQDAECVGQISEYTKGKCK